MKQLCRHNRIITLGLQKLRQLRDVRRDPPVNRDTSHMAGNRHTEEKYEHTNRKGSKKTPVWVPCRCSDLGGDDGPCAFLRRMPLAQTEGLYLRASSLTGDLTSPLGTVLGVEGVAPGVVGVMGV